MWTHVKSWLHPINLTSIDHTSLHSSPILHAWLAAKTPTVSQCHLCCDGMVPWVGDLAQWLTTDHCKTYVTMLLHDIFWVLVGLAWHCSSLVTKLARAHTLLACANVVACKGGAWCSHAAICTVQLFLRSHLLNAITRRCFLSKQGEPQKINFFARWGAIKDSSTYYYSLIARLRDVVEIDQQHLIVWDRRFSRFIYSSLLIIRSLHVSSSD